MTRKTLTRAATCLALIATVASAQADLAVPLPAEVWSESAAAIAANAWEGWEQPASGSGTAFALASIVTPDSSALPSSSSASLWTFITSVRAQQSGDTFSVLETNLSLVLEADALPPSQVPLPAAAWCLLMGLLGMAGVRLTGQGTRRADGETNTAGPQPLPA